MEEIKKLAELLAEVQGQQVKLQTVTNEPRINSQAIRKYFLSRLNYQSLQNSFGKHGFELNEENTKVVELVCQYLNNEPEFENNQDKNGVNYSLNRGLWIYGRCGSGKTEIVKAYRDLKKKLFQEAVGFKTCVDMNIAYQRIDVDTNKPEKLMGISKYLWNLNPSEKIFDDLGAEETTLKDYGNPFSVMPYIFGERHKGSKKRCITHVTTNLTPKQVGELYGDRIDSRSYEMFNMIVLGKNTESIDYRKI